MDDVIPAGNDAWDTYYRAHGKLNEARTVLETAEILVEDCRENVRNAFDVADEAWKAASKSNVHASYWDDDCTTCQRQSKLDYAVKDA